MKNSINFKQIKYFVITMVLIGITPMFYFGNQYETQLNTIYTDGQNEAKHQLNYSKKEVYFIGSQLGTSLNLLADNRVLLQFIQDPSSKNKALLETLWSLTVTNLTYISQVRFLDVNGREVSRIDHGVNGISITPEHQLQDKSKRDYFIYAQTLAASEIGFFGVDLETENGKSLIPPQPVLRLFTPVEVGNERKGYLVFNVDAYNIVTQVEQSINTGYSLEFINEDGYYLASKDKRKTLGHLIPERNQYNLLVERPELWKLMKSQKSGSVDYKDVNYSFSKIELGGTYYKSTLYLLLKNNHLQESNLQSHKLTFIIYEAIMALLLIISLSIIISRYISKHRTTSLESQLALAALNGMSAIVITDKKNRIIKVNDEFTRLSGWEEHEVLGKSPSIFQSGDHKQDFYIEMWKALETDGLWEGEVINKRKDGSLLTEILRIQAVFNKEGKMEFYIASFVDITARKELENQLRDLSEKDGLTQCWNRRKFEREFAAIIHEFTTNVTPKPCCLAIVDIDHFKRINDNYGHDVGDKVIIEVGRILQKESRPNDFIARIGGEEFAVILPNTNLKEAEVILNRLRVAVSLYADIRVSISGGVTDICHSNESSYKRADIALYESKTSGRNQISCFSTDDMKEIA